MKTTVCAIAAILLLSLSPAYADFYQWTGKDGVLHITNDMQNVPEDQRAGVKVFKSTPAEKTPMGIQPVHEPPRFEERKEELYGDETLEWWLQTFRKKNEEINSAESAAAVKRQFIDLFEGGRRLGQIYGQTEAETYGKYKKELPDDEERLKTLKDEREELLRKARIFGVPKEIRGE